MSTELHVEVAIVGWGKAGKTIAAKLAAGGTRVALIERSEAMVGGTCINIGCVPTKALLHDAAERRGEDPAEYFDQAKQRRDALTAKLNSVNRQMVEQHEAAVVIIGEAVFTGERTIQVRGGDEALTVTADKAVIGTGSTPRPFEVDGIDAGSPRVLDSTTAQAVEPLPARLAIVGAGPIGLEFATMFAGFGSEVTVLNRGERLLPSLDEELAGEIEEHLAHQGVSVLHGVTIESGSETESGLTLQLSNGETVETDALMPATGRVPATAGLGLEAAGIAVDDSGAITVDEHLRASADNVWAVGDVNGGPQFTYVSFDDHRIVLPQLQGQNSSRTTSDRVAVPTTTFMNPPLGLVGMTASEAREAGHTVVTASKPVAKIAAMPRPKAIGNTAGRISFVVDAETDLVLGAQLWTIDAQEFVNLVALAMRAGVTATELRDGIWTHPSTTEALNEVLAELS